MVRYRGPYLVSEQQTKNVSIVVIGHMNPALHHPHWYKEIGAISEHRYNEALETENLICTRPLSNFKAGPLTVTCELEKWQAIAEDETSSDELVNAASKVFIALYHTPITAFGFNFSFQVDASLPQLSVLSRGAHLQDLGFETEGLSSVTFALSRRSGKQTINVT